MGSFTVRYAQLLTSPTLAAQAAGIFQKNGLDVTTTHIAQGSTNMQAIIAGDTQVAEVGGTETISAAENGVDVVVIANLMPVYPFKLMANSSIQSLADLKGKTLGITGHGSVDDIADHAAFQKLGVPDPGANIVPIGAEDARVAALLNGTIDATVASPIAVPPLEAAGFHVLADYPALGLPTATTITVVRRSWMDDHREVVQRYIDSLVQATAREKRDVPFDVQFVQASAGLADRPDPADVVQVYTAGQPILPYSQTDQFSDAIAQLQEQTPNASAEAVDFSTLLDNSFVQSAADRGLDKS